MSQYLADELRQIADSKQNNLNDKAIGEIVETAITMARLSASDGLYSCQVRDKRLSITAVAQGVIKGLRNHAFDVDVVQVNNSRELPYVELKW